MQYVKKSILEQFIGLDNGLTVHELVSKLGRPYKALEKRLKAYYLQFLLCRIKEGRAYRYSLTERGKIRLDYLKKLQNI